MNSSPLGPLTTTPYGRLVLVKIALFLTLLTVAVINRFVLTPWIRSDEEPWSGATALSWTIVAEQMLGLAVIVVISVLGMLPQATSAH